MEHDAFPDTVPSRIDVALLLLTLLVTVVAYGPALGGGFIWDDNTYVRDNPTLRSLSGLGQIWLHPSATPQYHPLIFSSFWVEYQLWGANPIGYHVINLLLHLVNVVLVWWVLERLRVPGSLLAAAIFALHPVHVESVAWISERKNVLSVVLALLTTLAWLRFVDRGGGRSYVAVLWLFAATLLAKFVLAPLAVCLLLLGIWRRPQAWRSQILAVLPLLGMAVAIGLVAIWREASHGHPPFDFSFAERVLIAARALVFYVTKLLWPSGLTAIYPKWAVDSRAVHGWLFPMLVFGGLVAVVMSRRRLGAGPLLAVLWFVLLLLPLIGFIDFNPMRYLFVFDHFQYLPSLGLFALVAAGVVAAGGTHAGRLGVVGVCFVLGGLSYRQAAVYRDAETFWLDNIEKNPTSWAGYGHLASTLVSNGRLEQALPYFARAVAINPYYSTAFNHWGIVLDRMGRWDEAVVRYESALQIDDRLFDVHNNLGVTLSRLGRFQEAEDHFAAAVTIKPDYVAAWYHRGIVAAQLGRSAMAAAHWREVLRLRPDHDGARRQLEALSNDVGPTS